jgi:hypothetical protein
VTDDETRYGAPEDIENTRRARRAWLAVTLLALGAIVAVMLARRRRVKRSTADSGALAGLLADVGDSISDYQNAVAGETYLDTAGHRSSVRRRARFSDDNDNDRVYASSTGAGNTTVTFGDSGSGARPQFGTDKVTAVYRTGVGEAGNVERGAVDDRDYLPVWDHAVTAGDDPDIREVVLQGVDTAPRRPRIWWRRPGSPALDNACMAFRPF